NTMRALASGLGVSVSGFDMPAELSSTSVSFTKATTPLVLTAEYTSSVTTNASRVAAAIFAARARLVPSCAATAVKEMDCVAGLISVVGRAAYRRPVSPAEQTGLRASYNALRANWPYESALPSLLEVLLSSPAAFHLSEIGEPAQAQDRRGARRLTAHETA